MKEEEMKRIRPFGIVAQGLAAGLIGTACMTVLQEVMARRHRRAVAMGHPVEEIDPWERAPAPAKLARRVSEGVLHRDIPAERISFFTNAVHWAFGAQMGIAYALLERLARGRPALRGPLFGLAVWAQSYATLVPLGLYKWPWHYRRGAIAKDVSYHLLYGSGVAAGYRLVTRAK
jgi:hypothetical protein